MIAVGIIICLLLFLIAVMVAILFASVTAINDDLEELVGQQREMIRWLVWIGEQTKKETKKNG